MSEIENISVVKRKQFAEQSINMRASGQTMETACTKFMQNLTFMISRAPFVINSFVREQEEGEQIINIQVRFSPETPQQRGGGRREKGEASGESLQGLGRELPVRKHQ